MNWKFRFKIYQHVHNDWKARWAVSKKEPKQQEQSSEKLQCLLNG